MKRERLDVIIPIFNEDACIAPLIDRLLSFREKMTDLVDVAFIFVDDGSQDESFAILEEAARRFPFCKTIRFRRNFGHQMAITAGVDASDGDWAAVIDADLQDPPELLRDMLLMARNGGYEIVYGKRTSREGETAFKLITAKLFYRALSRLCDVDIPQDAGDFRLMRKEVVDALRLLPERHRFMRGLAPWLGFSSGAFEYRREPRCAGTTKYHLRKMIQLAITAILSFSVIPLRIATFVGGAAILIATCLGFWFLYRKLFSADVFIPGYASTVCIMLFMGGIQTSLLGVIGEYLAKIFEESKGRPIYLIKETRNLDASRANLNAFPRWRGYGQWMQETEMTIADSERKAA